MYDDYEVVYKSNLNEYLILWIVFCIFMLAMILFTFFSLSKVYKKANRSGIAPWIPIYNTYILVEIANISKKYFFLTFIPILNIYAFYKISMSIAQLFKKSSGFGYGLLFLPFIFYPILAFSDSEYIGINLYGLDSKNTVEEIPVIDENKVKEIEVKVNDNVDKASSNINISIGGGKYQKDYTANLTDVDRTQVVNKVVAEKEAKKDPSNNRFIKDIPVVEEKVEPAPVNSDPNMFSVPFINDKPQPESSNTINGVAISSKAEEIAPAKVMPNANGEYHTCPNCGTRVAEGADICFICGQKLK